MIQQSHFWVCIQKKWNHYLRWCLYAHVHCSITHNSQDMEKTYKSCDGWMDKKMWYIYSWPLNNTGVNLCMIYSRPSISSVPPHSQIQPTTDCIVQGLWLPLCSIHYWKIFTYKWTYAVQTRIIQGSTTYNEILSRLKKKKKKKEILSLRQHGWTWRTLC